MCRIVSLEPNLAPTQRSIFLLRRAWLEQPLEMVALEPHHLQVVGAIADLDDAVLAVDELELIQPDAILFPRSTRSTRTGRREATSITS